ncbi:MAG TPA: hypothetical protein VLA12_21440 [Planctomycetaceae bacterium]|nr:hypothetical protein [Planctomycetaceae bacterium]
MNRYNLSSSVAALLLGCCLGCGSELPPPLEMTEDVKQSIAAEDAAIDAAESANSE